MGQVEIRHLRTGTPRDDDEVRILIERDPPAGVDPDARWIPELAPTSWLLTRFGDDPRRFPTFRNRYLRLLRSKTRTRLLEELARLARERRVVLLVIGPDPARSPEVVVSEALARRFGCRAAAAD